MATAIKNATYQLTKVIELREWDEAAECYLPVEPEKRIPCAHCGKLCQKVYEVVRDQDHKTFLIGPSCCKKNLFGWEPEKQVAKQMEKEAEKLAKSRAREILVNIATPIAEEVTTLAIPEIEYKGTKYSSQVPCYGIGSAAWVLCREGLTEERKQCCIHAWRYEQVRNRVGALRLDEKKTVKVREIAMGLLR